MMVEKSKLEINHLLKNKYKSFRCAVIYVTFIDEL